MRKVLNTTKGCPIVSLYLALGHLPARFEIQKMRLLYLKYILTEKEDSLVRRFLNLQLEMPTKGDWASTCLKDLKDLKILCSMKEIEIMSYKEFKRLLKTKIKEKALIYLLSKVRSKGKENKYKDLSMAEYLLPENRILSIEEKQRLFEVKHRMTKIPSNFPKTDETNECYCGGEENMEHIYNCEVLKEGKNETMKYEKIYNGTLKEQIEVFRQFERNMKTREKLKKTNCTPCGLFVDPLPVLAVMG